MWCVPPLFVACQVGDRSRADPSRAGSASTPACRAPRSPPSCFRLPRPLLPHGRSHRIRFAHHRHAPSPSTSRNPRPSLWRRACSGTSGEDANGARARDDPSTRLSRRRTHTTPHSPSLASALARSTSPRLLRRSTRLPPLCSSCDPRRVRLRR